ncbi:hypothetical protein QJQ45_020893 [Haematococcus lacustris]|nr:hypothetical protein QJQ45_020893 [Haematococcus lacustris]
MHCLLMRAEYSGEYVHEDYQPHHQESGQLVTDQLRSWKLTKGQVKQASGLNIARRDTQQWLAPIHPHLQHLAAASSAGTSLMANLKHITVTLATWDAVWEVYLDPKWARQRLRLYGAQNRALEQFFMPRGTDQLRGRVVLVDEHHTTRVSLGVNGQQPCEEELDHEQPTRRAGWKPPAGQVEPRLLRPAWSQQHYQPVRGLKWCPVVAPRKPPQAPCSSQAASEPGPSTPPPAKRSKRTKAELAGEPTKGTGKAQSKAATAKPAPQPGRWLDRDCNAALNMQRIGESRAGLHFIKVDSRVLHGVCQQLGLTRETEDEFTAEPARSNHWDRWFSTKQLANQGFEFERTVETDGVSVCVHYTRPLPTPPAPPSAAGPSSSNSSPVAAPGAAAVAAHELGLPRIGKGLAEQREFVFNPATQIGVGIDPGVTQAVSAASGVWDPATGQLLADQLRRWKLTKGEVKHGSGLNNARRDTERWLAPIKPHLQHLAAASSAGTSLVANLKHITVTLATWDAVWEVYLDPKWARQRLRLYGAQDRTLEQFFKKLEEDMAEVSMERHERAKQLVVFFGAASIGTRGGWGADAVLRACRKVVCRPRGTDQRRGRVVLVDEHRTTRVSSAMNGQQPCERQLNKRRATRPAGWKPPAGQVEPRLLRPAWSQQHDQPVRGMMWCPVVPPRKPPQAPRSSQEASQPAASEPGPSSPLPAKRSKRTKAEQPAEPTQPTKGKGKAQSKAAKAKPAPQPGRWLDRDCNAALNMQRIGESKWRPLELCWWPGQGVLPAKGKEYPGLGYKRVRDKPPKAQQQQPAEAHGALILASESVPAQASTDTPQLLTIDCSSGKAIVERREFMFDPATQIGVGIDPGVTQAVSAVSAIASASLYYSAGTSLVANLKHITVTMATWDAVWEVYLDPKWARQRLRLYGAQDRALEQFFMQLRAGVNGQQSCEEEELDHEQPTRRAGWKPPAGQVEPRLLRPAWSQQHDQPVRGLKWCPVVAPRKPPQAPCSSQADTQPATSKPGPSTPPPAKRTKAELAGEPTKGTGKAQSKAAKAKPAPQPGRWLDRDCNAALNMQRTGEQCYQGQRLQVTCHADLLGDSSLCTVSHTAAQKFKIREHEEYDRILTEFGNTAGESRWRPLEMCYWPEQGALPAKGKEYHEHGYKRLRDKPPKAQQQQQRQPAVAQKHPFTCLVGMLEYEKGLAPCSLSNTSMLGAGAAPYKAQKLCARHRAICCARTSDVVFRTSSGAWRIRPYQEKDFASLVHLQHTSFYTPPPLAPLEQLANASFRAEVLEGLRKKERSAHPDSFQILVAESWSGGEELFEQPTLPAPQDGSPDAPSLAPSPSNPILASDGAANVTSIVSTSSATHQLHPPSQTLPTFPSLPTANHSPANLGLTGLVTLAPGLPLLRTWPGAAGQQLGPLLCSGLSELVQLMQRSLEVIQQALLPSLGRPPQLLPTLAVSGWPCWTADDWGDILSSASSSSSSATGSSVSSWPGSMPSTGLECLQAAGANCTAAVLLVTGMKGSSRQVKVAAASGEGGDWVPAGHEAASGVVCYPLPQGWEQENLPDGELQGTVEVTLMQDREVLRSLGPGAFEYAYISSMAVAPAVRRRGLAQALLLAAQQQALLWSQHHLLLHVYDDNLPAVKLYLKHGFKQIAADPSWRRWMGARVRLLMYRDLGQITPLPAKRTKRTKAEPAAEPTKGTGKAAKAKPAPQPGRWLDRDCNAALNMQRIGESRWRPLELCYWPEQGKLPAKGKEYPGLGYKRLRDKQPKAQQQQPAAAHQPAHASMLPAPADRAWEALGGGPADLTFPASFLGQWEVTSVLVKVDTPLGPDMVPDQAVVERARREDLQRPVMYKVVAFRTNSQGEVVYDRAFNTAAMLSSYYDRSPADFLQRIRWNPDDPNVLQLSMPDGLAVRTRVTRRLEDNPSPDRIETSEYLEQVFEDAEMAESQARASPSGTRLKASQCFTKYKYRSEASTAPGQPAIVATQVVSDFLTPNGSNDAQVLQAMNKPVVMYTYKMAFRRVEPQLMASLPSTPLPAKRSKRTKAELAAEPTKGTGKAQSKAATAKPAPQPGRWQQQCSSSSAAAAAAHQQQQQRISSSSSAAAAAAAQQQQQQRISSSSSAAAAAAAHQQQQQQCISSSSSASAAAAHQQQQQRSSSSSSASAAAAHQQQQQRISSSSSASLAAAAHQQQQRSSSSRAATVADLQQVRADKEQLQAAQQELQADNESLEEQIEERTHAIQLLQRDKRRLPRGTDQLRGRVVFVDEHHTTRVSLGVNGQQSCEEELDHEQPTRLAPRKPPQVPCSSQAATQPVASEPGPSTPLPAKRSKRTKAELAAE